MQISLCCASPSSAPYPRSREATLGDWKWANGKLDDAERAYRAGVTVLERAARNNDPQIALISSNLSLVYIERGQFDRAALELERSVAVARMNVKDASLPLGWALVNLANVYRFLGETDKVLTHC